MTVAHPNPKPLPVARPRGDDSALLRAELERAREALTTCESVWLDVRAGLHRGASAELRQQVRELGRAREEARRRFESAREDAVAVHVQAFETNPESSRARAELADLYWLLLGWAEERGDRETSSKLVRALADADGQERYADLVEGVATLEVESDPPGAAVRLARLEPDAEGRLALVDARELGTTPMAPVDLEPGSYVVELSLPRQAPARRPVQLRRGSDVQLVVRLFAAREVGPDYVYVPAGRFTMGGDVEANGSRGSREVFVDNAAVARYPVTVGEYMLFLDDLAQRDPARAIRFTPARPGLSAADPREPVTGIPYAAAATYAEWISQRSGVELRLPREEEWEKAARGVDRRAYVWGDTYDADLCHCRQPTEGEIPELAPVGQVAADRSVYGVRDLAGGVAEWTASDYDLAGGQKVVRGGSFVEDGSNASRVARRARLAADSRPLHVGFRLVRPLPQGGGERCHEPVVPERCDDAQREPAAPVDEPQEVRSGVLALFRDVVADGHRPTPRELLQKIVVLARAERALWVSAEAPYLTVEACCNARGELLPLSDQQVDGPMVQAALAAEQPLVVDAGGRQTIAVSLARGSSCLLLERRFVRFPFSAADRWVVANAADLLLLTDGCGALNPPPPCG